VIGRAGTRARRTAHRANGQSTDVAAPAVVIPVLPPSSRSSKLAIASARPAPKPKPSRKQTRLAEVVQVAAARKRSRRALPEYLAEIEASPAGPGVAAVFDFDGTLIAGYSVTEFLKDRLRRRAIDAAGATRALSLVFDALTGAAGNRELILRGLQEFKGHAAGEIELLGQRLFKESISKNVFPEMRAVVEAHRRRGHTLVIATSATHYQVAPIAKALGVEHVLCTKLETRDGVLTGKPHGPVLWGRHKAAAVRDLAAGLGFELRRSWFYADGDEDQALMHLVGHPRPTNAQEGLARIAARRGWPVRRFTSRGAEESDAALRYAAAVLSVLPISFGAIALQMLTGDKRAAANLLTGTIPELALALGKVKLNVIGEHHLWMKRPAVFIFNHRNLFDAQIVGALVRRDFGGVAKKELENDPFFSIARQFVPIAFIDRSDKAAAVAAMEPVTKMLRSGLSMVIAPEGTRITDVALGAFKKGAFRMAMAAGVPIVPIVIRNVEEIGGRNAVIPRPGTVDVAVLPPIPTTGWTVQTLEKRIEEIRQLYMASLDDWPGPARDFE
jgi:putative phosphoserine phosphatase / 1-acylglycerol-3-phosphate O-acyltransferase